MCDPISIGAAAAVAGTGYSVYQGERQAGEAKKARSQATAAATSAEAQRKKEFAKLDKKSPNLAGLNLRNRSAAAQGVSSTRLTGPTGVEASALSLSRNTLLGGGQ